MAVRRFQPYSDSYEQLSGRFVDRPIAVSFRDIVGPLPADAGAHRIHPYPARLLRQVPVFVLGCEQLISPGQVVYDPFCGSGTVLAEAMTHGYDSWGTDPNPLAALISRVKVTAVARPEIEESARQIVRSARARTRAILPISPFLDRWFSTSTRTGLEGLRAAIEHHSVPDHRDVFLLSLSLTAERLAHKDGRIPVPVRLAGETPDIQLAAIRQRFVENLRFILDRLPTYDSAPARASVFETQAVACLSITGEGRAARPNLVLTSPPYGAAQKYIRSSSISLAVLNMAPEANFSKLNAMLAGREWLRESDRNPRLPEGLISVPGVTELLEKIGSVSSMREAIYRQYFIDMWESFTSSASALESGGAYVLVSSSNTVAGMQVPTHEVLAAMLQELGLKRVLSLEDRIAGRALMTRRASTASTPIQSEVVHFFRKSRDG